VKLNEEIFVAKGLIIEDMGYMQIYPYDTWRDKNIPPYQQGQILEKFIIKISEGKTEVNIIYYKIIK
jgi:DNA topoisomerase IA